MTPDPIAAMAAEARAELLDARAELLDARRRARLSMILRDVLYGCEHLALDDESDRETLIALLSAQLAKRYP